MPDDQPVEHDCRPDQREPGDDHGRVEVRQGTERDAVDKTDRRDSRGRIPSSRPAMAGNRGRRAGVEALSQRSKDPNQVPLFSVPPPRCWRACGNRVIAGFREEHPDDDARSRDPERDLDGRPQSPQSHRNPVVVGSYPGPVRCLIRTSPRRVRHDLCSVCCSDVCQRSLDLRTVPGCRDPGPRPTRGTRHSGR